MVASDEATAILFTAPGASNSDLSFRAALLAQRLTSAVTVARLAGTENSSSRPRPMTPRSATRASTSPVLPSKNSSTSVASPTDAR